MQPAPATKAACELLREVVPVITEDTELTSYVEKVAEQIGNGAYIEKVEAITGPLAF